MQVEHIKIRVWLNLKQETMQAASPRRNVGLVLLLSLEKSAMRFICQGRPPKFGIMSGIISALVAHLL